MNYRVNDAIFVFIILLKIVVHTATLVNPCNCASTCLKTVETNLGAGVKYRLTVTIFSYAVNVNILCIYYYRAYYSIKKYLASHVVYVPLSWPHSYSINHSPCLAEVLLITHEAQGMKAHHLQAHHCAICGLVASPPRTIISPQ